MNVLFLTHSFPRMEVDAAGSFILRPAVTLRGTDVRLARKVRVAKPLFGHVLKHSAAVTTVSHWLKEETEALAPGIHPMVAPMPVSTDLFEPRPGSARDAGRLLYVGRLTQQKGVEHLLYAMSAM